MMLTTCHKVAGVKFCYSKIHKISIRKKTCQLKTNKIINVTTLTIHHGHGVPTLATSFGTSA